jgi:hypothetical protein
MRTFSWPWTLGERHAAPDSAAALVSLEVGRIFAQLMMAAALDERVSRVAAEASMVVALGGVRNDAQAWLDSGSPTAEVIATRIKTVKATFKQAQDAAAHRVAEYESDDEYAIARPCTSSLRLDDNPLSNCYKFDRIGCRLPTKASQLLGSSLNTASHQRIGLSCNVHG